MTPEEKLENKRSKGRANYHKNKDKYRAYRIKNKDKIAAQTKIWQQNNKEHIKSYREENKEHIANVKKQWETKNKDKVTEYNKKKYQENKEEVKAHVSQWQKDNRERKNAYMREYLKGYWEENPSAKIAKNVRKRIYDFVSGGVGKSEDTKELLGCDFQTLKQHLEAQFKEGMSWDNYGKAGWHIDHIVPCALFDMTKPEQQKSCFNYQNLQPLWRADNLIKSNLMEVCPV